MKLGKKIPRYGIGLSNRPFYPVFKSLLAICREEWTDKAKCQISALAHAQLGRLWSLVLEIHTEMLTGHFLVID